MDWNGETPCVAFAGTQCLGAGRLWQVALLARDALERGEARPLLIFDDASGGVLDVDLRGTGDDIRRRLEPVQSGGAPAESAEELNAAPRGRGRPRLGVVAREVTLLPRHWEWLSGQPGGASVALRRLVEEARRANAERDRLRQAREAVYRFMSAMAGDLPGFEEASRALFAGAAGRFLECTAPWPVDVRDHARRLAECAFPRPEQPVA